MNKYLVKDCDNRALYPYLVRFIGGYSTYFSLVYFQYDKKERYKATVRTIKKRLSPFLVSSTQTNNMPSMITRNINNHIYLLALYRTNIESLRVLETVHSLWDWDYPKYPMDLCFFRNGYAWFVSSAHEQYSILYASEEDYMLDDFEDLGFELVPCGTVDRNSLFSTEQLLSDQNVH